MSPRASRWMVAATLAAAVALLFALPRFAATVVQGAIERESANDRVAFAEGRSPWSWRFSDVEDVVAGRAFGGGRLATSPPGLSVQATDAGGFEIGLVLRRDADLVRLDTFYLDATASATGRYALAVRETLTSPGRHADLGTLTPAEVGRPVRLDRLSWTDDQGRAVDPPRRAAMLRIRAVLPVGATLSLRSARLALAEGASLPPPVMLPDGLSAEGLLALRDRERAADPLVAFGEALERVRATSVESYPSPAWPGWVEAGVYLALVSVVGWRRQGDRARRPVDEGTGSHAGWRALAGAGLDVALVLAGPLWFIAGLGLSLRLAPPGIAAFAIGVGYAVALGARRQLPSWHWAGAWRQAGWPLLAVAVAGGIALAAGHSPAWPPAGRTLLYIGWALFQQWLILAVVAALLDRAVPRAVAILLAALAFALLHTPNGLLMQLCFVAELGWAWWYLRHRALLPVAVAHALSAVILQACVAGGLLRSLEVSARFLA
ncbi:membrane protease YdiL (CAAX protease family) [Luteibacter sp. 1214]|uniref:CPBP family glutamic-type intramembrane protease n=1 Tax=Luteibacter sp. 1214 TaxID=2817735 RepID=UPI002863A960|nr:CPBP family glutamic-type intramembrane protease [Luteibacter sp. 1214]MDR6641704.1 membrane protease YdiL (CAAX protease family) [Luteibacter sp. 1214]